MRNRVFFVMALLFGSPTLLLGQSPVPLPSPDPSEDVVDRMNRLEAETQSLRGEVQWLREHPVRLPTVDATPTGMASAPTDPAPADGNYFTLDELRGEMKKLAWTKGDFSIVPYGYLWGNTVYSTERTSPGSYTLFVLSPSGAVPQSNECIVDVRNTRLGFDVLGPQIPLLDFARGGGKVEIDFQSPLNTTAGENKATVMLRHAYFEVKDDDFRLLGGQTWDVISPLNPDMLMYSVGWDGGNIGYRRAQFRGERYFNFSDVSMVTAELSINPQVFVDNITTTTPAATLTGEPCNWPIIEGRTAWTIGHRGAGCYPIEVGLSGHIGEQEFIYSVGKADELRRTWSGNVDVRVPITERLGVEGECYVGENLGTFLGGVGQGVNPYTLNTIRDAGGWAEIWYDWSPRLHSHVGYSVDDPNDHDFAHYIGGKTYNQFYFGNISYDVTKKFLVGLEVSSWKTLYYGQLPGDSVRTEFVAKYGF